MKTKSGLIFTLLIITNVFFIPLAQSQNYDNLRMPRFISHLLHVVEDLLLRHQDVTEEDLVGDWTCHSIASINDVPGTLLSASGWQETDHGFFYMSENTTVTFSQNESNALVITTSFPDPLELREDPELIHEANAKIYNNTLFYRMNENSEQMGQAQVKWVARDTIELTKFSNLNRQPLYTKCKKQ